MASVWCCETQSVLSQCVKGRLTIALMSAPVSSSILAKTLWPRSTARCRGLNPEIRGGGKKITWEATFFFFFLQGVNVDQRWWVTLYHYRLKQAQHPPWKHRILSVSRFVIHKTIYPDASHGPDTPIARPQKLLRKRPRNMTNMVPLHGANIKSPSVPCDTRCLKQCLGELGS